MENLGTWGGGFGACGYEVTCERGVVERALVDKEQYISLSEYTRVQ